jgi:hypothetical protein
MLEGIELDRGEAFGDGPVDRRDDLVGVAAAD